MAAKRTKKPDLPEKRFATKASWRAWLDKQHAKSAGVWLLFAKKDWKTRTVGYPEAVDVALCYGWIDGLRQVSTRPGHFRQRFVPRVARSLWSKINRGKVTALIASGEMRPAGLAAVEQAKTNGRWETAYDGGARATVPEDLAAAFKKNPKAAAFFETVSRANRYAVLWRVQTAVRPETRARRIADLVAMLARGGNIHE